jgi:desampylase
MTQPRSLMISADNARALRRAAADAYPKECCGLLVGEGNGDMAVTCITPTANTADDPTRKFAIDPQMQFDLLRAMRDTEQQVIGHYHSHPGGPAEPSAHDLAMAHDPEAIWVVIAADAQGATTLRAFVRPAEATAFTEIPVTETP